MKKVKYVALIIIFALFFTGCSANYRNQTPNVTLSKIQGEFQAKENVVFLLKTIIQRDELLATVNLKGVQFMQTEQTYFIGNAAEYRLEVYKTPEQSYIKGNDNKWISLEAGGATELKAFINTPNRIIELMEYGNYEVLKDPARINRRNHVVISGALTDSGVAYYIENFIPELLDIVEEVIIEVSFYIDEGNGGLSKIDLFINEFSGKFSLVTEMTIQDFNVPTEIIPPTGQ